jgi:hypothetical protein
MITRYALFEGQIHTGQTEAFRAAILADVLPHWESFPDVLAVRSASKTSATKALLRCPSS